MFPILLVGIFVFLFCRPQRSQSFDGEEIYPSIGDVLIISIPIQNTDAYLIQQNGIVEIFANKGYRVVPIGVDYKNGILIQKMQVVDMIANIAVPKDLGKGIVVTSINKNF